jgi:DNA gyrase/topoisomerase IV subunit B
MNFKKGRIIFAYSQVSKNTKKEEKEISPIEFFPNSEIFLMINHFEISEIKAQTSSR